MGDTKRVVVVGAGGISNAWFPPLIEEKVEVVGVVDLRKESAEAQLAKYKLQAEAGTDLKQMLAKTRPDFVLDLTIPDAHCNVTCTALEAGYPVIGEKPMAASMEQARKMVAASEASGKLYMVSQSRRWDVKHHQLRETVVGGEIGSITTLNCDFYIAAHFGGFRDEMPSPLILDMAIHHFDLARYISGADPVAVYAREFNPKGSWYKGDVSAACIFEMSNGIMFTYRGSWCSEGCHTAWNGNWRVIGDKGTLLYDHEKTPEGEVVNGNEGFYRPLRKATIAPESLKFGGMHGALREMLAYLREGKMPQTECHDNIKSLAMVFGAIESSKLGKRVELTF